MDFEREMKELVEWGEKEEERTILRKCMRS